MGAADAEGEQSRPEMSACVDGEAPPLRQGGYEVGAAPVVAEGTRALDPPHPHPAQDLGSIDARLAGNGDRELSTRLQDYVDCNVPNYGSIMNFRRGEKPLPGSIANLRKCMVASRFADGAQNTC